MTSEGFGRKLRLLNASDYRAVFEQAQYKTSCPQILILARENTGADGRLGLVIAKKHIKLAVQRNRIKRLIRESFRHHQQLLSGLDIVILARGGLDKLENQEISQILQKLWQDLIRRRNRKAAR